MPLNLPDNKSVQYFISAIDDHGLDGASLLSGQTVAVASADPATVVLTPDATPKNAPDGTPSIASGVASSANPVGSPNKPIALTSHISNADGSPGTTDGTSTGTLIPDATDTITIVPGSVKTEGILFGVPA
jgi:hypothetical protein